MYECHVTIEYVSPNHAKYDRLVNVALNYGFRVAKLYKWNKEYSDLDTFMTGHSASFEALKLAMTCLIEELYGLRLQVTRYKIEQILLDSKNGDSI